MMFVVQQKGHEPIDLTKADLVEWRGFERDGDNTLPTDTAEITNAKNGEITLTYNAVAPEPGEYELELEITWLTGVSTFVPTGSFYCLLHIHE